MSHLILWNISPQPDAVDRFLKTCVLHEATDAEFYSNGQAV